MGAEPDDFHVCLNQGKGSWFGSQAIQGSSGQACVCLDTSIEGRTVTGNVYNRNLNTNLRSFILFSCYGAGDIPVLTYFLFTSRGTELLAGPLLDLITRSYLGKS
jgi:hypothetical protein